MNIIKIITGIYLIVSIILDSMILDGISIIIISLISIDSLMRLIDKIKFRRRIKKSIKKNELQKSS